MICLDCNFSKVLMRAMKVLVPTYHMAMVAGMGLPYYNVATVGFQHVDGGAIKITQSFAVHDLGYSSYGKSPVGEI